MGAQVRTSFTKRFISIMNFFRLMVGILLFCFEVAGSTIVVRRRKVGAPMLPQLTKKVGTHGPTESRVVELAPSRALGLEPLHDEVHSAVRRQAVPTDAATDATASSSYDSHGDDPITSSALIRTWFDEHGLSKSVQKLRSANPDDGDGIADPDGGAEWTYFLNSCMQQRQQVVAREVLDRKCQRVIEVGGYLTPLDGFLLKLHVNDSAALPTEYLNIDPSMEAARITKVSGMRSVHVPMTVADFVSKSSQEFRKKFQLEGSANTCLVVLGIWDPHVKARTDRLALGMLLGNASFAALESPKDEMRHLKVVEELAGLAGLKRESNKSMKFDCQEALKHEESHYPGDEILTLHILSK